MSSVHVRYAASSPSQASEPRLRAPLLERLIARADAARAIVDWRAAALRTLAPAMAALPPVACAALAAYDPHEPAAERRTAAQEWLFLATPVHYEAGLRSVTLAPHGILALEPHETETLICDFNRLFSAPAPRAPSAAPAPRAAFTPTATSAAPRLLRGRGSRLLCAIPAAGGLDAGAAAAPVTVDPETVQGMDIGASLPRGTGAATLKRLMSEMEMWLHTHPLNEERRARGKAEISGLWLWGGGASQALPPLDIWSAGDDDFFGAYAPVTRYPGDGRSGVIVTAESPGAPGWEEFERSWLVPALAELRAGRLERLELSAGDLSHGLGRRALRRFWRRARPWWESLAQSAAEPSAAAQSSMGRPPE